MDLVDRKIIENSLNGYEFIKSLYSKKIGKNTVLELETRLSSIYHGETRQLTKRHYDKLLQIVNTINKAGRESGMEMPETEITCDFKEKNIRKTTGVNTVWTNKTSLLYPHHQKFPLIPFLREFGVKLDISTEESIEAPKKFEPTIMRRKIRNRAFLSDSTSLDVTEVHFTEKKNGEQTQQVLYEAELEFVGKVDNPEPYIDYISQLIRILHLLYGNTLFTVNDSRGLIQEYNTWL
ncbi:unnamed protein product, partial [marine sediment metagenome]